jgi:long-chain acyl-CoA synthetase
MGATLSYRDLDRASAKFAAWLQQSAGLTRGERVAIMLPNTLQYTVAMCGAFRAGQTVVNVNPLYTARELKHQLQDSGARVIVILENFASILEEIIADTSVEHVVVTGVGDMLRPPKGWIVNFVLRKVRKEVPPFSLPGHLRFRQALKLGDGKAIQPVELGYADIAFLQYTGGTTGVSKGAMLSHRNMVFNVQQTMVWQGDVYKGVEPIVAITALPLYHIFSLQTNCLTVMAQGGLNVLITNPRDMRGFVKVQHDYRRQHAVRRAVEHAGLRDRGLQSPADRGRRGHGRATRRGGRMEGRHGCANPPGLRADRDLARGNLQPDRLGLHGLGRPAGAVDRRHDRERRRQSAADR